MSATCPGCGKRGFRKGNTVTLQDPAVGPGGRRARVCSDCEKGALKVVAPRVASVVKQAATSDDTKDKLARVVRQLRTFAKMAQAQADKEQPGSDDHAFPAGRAEGLESAIEVIKREFQNS